MAPRHAEKKQQKQSTSKAKKQKVSSRRVSNSYPQQKRNANRKNKNNNQIKEQQASPAPVKTEADIEMDTLKTFDLTLDFGPSIGITRMERWERALKHGLNPSEEVRDIILQHNKDIKYTESLWNDYAILK